MALSVDRSKSLALPGVTSLEGPDCRSLSRAEVKPMPPLGSPSLGLLKPPFPEPFPSLIWLSHSSDAAAAFAARPQAVARLLSSAVERSARETPPRGCPLGHPLLPRGSPFCWEPPGGEVQRSVGRLSVGREATGGALNGRELPPRHREGGVRVHGQLPGGGKWCRLDAPDVFDDSRRALPHAETMQREEPCGVSRCFERRHYPCACLCV